LARFLCFIAGAIVRCIPLSRTQDTSNLFRAAGVQEPRRTPTHLTSAQQPAADVSIDQSLSRPGNSGGSFRDAFRKHFYLTTSGNFSDTALACSVAEMGIDRILFSVDWPFISNELGTSWLEKAALSAEDKVKVFSGNARKSSQALAFDGGGSRAPRPQLS
jgi:hypothetical protein